ncbi:hypothetical protein CDAR_238161 [Caerostris darwini]|uniref:Uncharacterized protein n=1 Tax=Caerostris darwini TaxID=1538125 RepID=A0AAV4TNG1_9ARAC|nr:hypothetical protein CDAR_238161 [Caerostris darwini]
MAFSLRARRERGSLWAFAHGGAENDPPSVRRYVRLTSAGEKVNPGNPVGLPPLNPQSHHFKSDDYYLWSKRFEALFSAPPSSRTYAGVVITLESFEWNGHTVLSGITTEEQCGNPGYS